MKKNSGFQKTKTEPKFKFANRRITRCDYLSWVGICPRVLERQTIIVSICNVECAFEP